MKIIKYLLLLILLAIIGLVVFVATQKSDFEISNTKLIHSPKSVVYNYVSEFKNWENWNAWTISDKETTFSYPERTIGTGGSFSWSGNEGNGTMRTIFSKENDSISHKMIFNNSESMVSWKLKDTLGGTKVTLKSKGEMSFMFKIYALINGGLEKMLSERNAKSLINLDRSLDYEINNYSIKVNGLASIPGGFYMQQTINSKIVNLERNVKIMLPKLTNFFKKNKVFIYGKPFVLYHAYDIKNGITNFSVCFPIKDEIFTSTGSDITSGTLVPFQAIKTTLTGDYSHLQEAWEKTEQFIRKNNFEKLNATPIIEIYKIGVDEEKRPSKWITEIYIAVKSKVIVPEIESSNLENSEISATATP
jgi:effector-binding domain-containing protein